MWELSRSVLHSTVGEATWAEVILVALLFVIILMFTWAPQIGEAAGGIFEGDDEA